MKNMEILPVTLRAENKISTRTALLMLALLFLLLFVPWMSSKRELFRQEGLYAAVTANYVDNNWTPAAGITAQAHNVAHNDVWPLYPLTVSGLYRLGVPMESALRIVSVAMLGILSLLAGIAAGKRGGVRAGIVAAGCCFGTIFALEKSVCGGPESMAACFLLIAQLLFFHYGSRFADWNTAWLAAAFFLALGFLTAGPVVILFFAFPLVFLRRPLSYSGKFRTPGFLVGVILLILVVLVWAYPFGMNLINSTGSSRWLALFSRQYWEDMLMFPLMFPLRMLPWSLVMWMPFCVALQAISPVPVFSRYLRTLFFSMGALAWLIPSASSSLIFYLIAPLAVLTGLNYELGIRRYSGFLRKSLSVGGLFFPFAMLVVTAVMLLPDNLLGILGEEGKMLFRSELKNYLYFAWSALALLLLLLIIYWAGRKTSPVWFEISLICFGIGVIGCVELLPYRLMEKDWRTLGSDISMALPPEADKIFKYEIDGMYCGLFYAGVPVYQLQELEQLDRVDEEVIYLISPQVPEYAGRQWESLLPDNYSCRGTPVSLWKGTKRQDEAE